MGHSHRSGRHIHHSKSRDWMRTHAAGSSDRNRKPGLEAVLKCDSDGSVEAVTGALSRINIPGADLSIIHSAVGDIHSSDIDLAGTGSRLIIGYQVDVDAGLDKVLKQSGVEVRLYNVIYRLTDDIVYITKSLLPHLPEEQITGAARVIALFKSSRKGIIIGCQVLSGRLAHGQHFRVISAAGTVYTGIIESMHREKSVIQKAEPGQQVGIKLKDFNRVRTGDMVESYKVSPAKDRYQWKPSGGIFRID